eukprot:365690-Chlamydomonas_euryale.AAC.12
MGQDSSACARAGLHQGVHRCPARAPSPREHDPSPRQQHHRTNVFVVLPRCTNHECCRFALLTPMLKFLLVRVRAAAAATVTATATVTAAATVTATATVRVGQQAARRDQAPSPMRTPCG